jgi:hypothetical protein
LTDELATRVSVEPSPARSAAIDDVKRAFVGTKTTTPDTAMALVASVLFEEAKGALRPEDGLTRDELQARVEDLALDQGLSGLIDIDQALGRFRSALTQFRTILPLSGIHDIKGPTRNQRSDRVSRLWLAITYAQPDVASTADVAPPTGELIDDTVTLLTRHVRRLLRDRFSRDRLLELRELLRRRKLGKALALLLFVSGCIWAARYVLAPEGPGATAGGQTVRLDDTGRLVLGHWLTWDSRGEPLSSYRVLRDGNDITARVRLFQKTFRDGVSYGFEDTAINPATIYVYEIARRSRLHVPALSAPYTSCAKCLEEKLQAARAAIAKGEPLAPSTPEDAIAGAQYSLGGISVTYVGQPLSFRASLVSTKMVGREVRGGSRATLDEHVWVECDLGDGPIEFWPQTAIQHTWSRAGRYLVRLRRADERTAKHTVIQAGFVTVLERRPDQASGYNDGYSYEFVFRDEASLPAALAAEILAPRLIRAPEDQMLFFRFDATRLKLWRAILSGGTIVSNFGDGTGSSNVIHPSESIDVIQLNHMYRHPGVYDAKFTIRSPHHTESTTVHVRVFIEAEKHFRRRRSDENIYGSAGYFTCSSRDIAPLILVSRPEFQIDAFTSVNDGVYFDLANENCVRKTAWLRPDVEAYFLWLDDGSGFIDNGQLFFSEAYVPVNRAPVSRPLNGFAALAEWDDDHNGLIDSNDRVWEMLRLWQDSDHNGRSSPGEVGPLRGTGIFSISLNYRRVDTSDAHGNSFVLASDVVGRGKDGVTVTGSLYTVRLAHDPSDLYDLVSGLDSSVSHN